MSGDVQAQVLKSINNNSPAEGISAISNHYSYLRRNNHSIVQVQIEHIQGSSSIDEYDEDKSVRKNWLIHSLRFILLYGKILAVIPTSLIVTRTTNIANNSVSVALEIEQITGTEDSSSSFNNQKCIRLKGGYFRKGFYILIQLFLISHVITRFAITYPKPDDILFMKWIWKVSFTQFILYNILIIYFFGYKCHLFKNSSLNFWTKVYEQSELIQVQFKEALSISLWKQEPTDSFLCLSFSIISCLMGLIHIMSLRSLGEYDGTKLNDDDNLKCIPFTNTFLEEMPGYVEADPTIQFLIQILISLPDIFIWGIWHFGDALRLTISYIIWKLYNTLNRHIQSLLDTSSNKSIKNQNYNKIIQLHQNITILLNIFDSIISPLTFVSIGFCTMYFCYYANFLLFGFGGVLRRICFTNWFIRTIVILWLTADINTKAHQITVWLEKLSSVDDVSQTNVNSLKQIPGNKLMVFTAQVYQEKIGFKGLNFFTVSTGFIGRIVSILLTYTVVILQFAGHNANGNGNAITEVINKAVNHSNY